MAVNATHPDLASQARHELVARVETFASPNVVADNPAAKVTAQEIAQRVQQARQWAGASGALKFLGRQWCDGRDRGRRRCEWRRCCSRAVQCGGGWGLFWWLVYDAGGGGKWANGGGGKLSDPETSMLPSTLDVLKSVQHWP